MQITSSGIDATGKVLPKYTADGDNINPPLTFSQIPDGTASLVLILDDPDAPSGVFTHWIVYDMSPATLQITEGSNPLTGKIGANSYAHVKYDGPAPPSGEHRYIFKLFAVDRMLNLPDGAGKQEVLAAIDGHIIEQAELVGTYSR